MQHNTSVPGAAAIGQSPDVARHLFVWRTVIAGADEAAARAGGAAGRGCSEQQGRGYSGTGPGPTGTQPVAPAQPAKQMLEYVTPLLHCTGA